MSDDFEFTDKSGRVIRLVCNDPDIVAYCGSEKVGELSFTDYHDGLILSFVNVHAAFQRAGIATEMVRYAKEQVGDFLLPGMSWNARREDQLHTSQDGRAFLNSCFRSGLLSTSDAADAREGLNEDDPFE